MFASLYFSVYLGCSKQLKIRSAASKLTAGFTTAPKEKQEGLKEEMKRETETKLSCIILELNSCKIRCFDLLMSTMIIVTEC